MENIGGHFTDLRKRVTITKNTISMIKDLGRNLMIAIPMGLLDERLQEIVMLVLKDFSGKSKPVLTLVITLLYFQIHHKCEIPQNLFESSLLCQFQKLKTPLPRNYSWKIIFSAKAIFYYLSKKFKGI